MKKEGLKIQNGLENAPESDHSEVFTKLSENREAYRLYGDEPLADGDIERYVRSNSKFLDKNILNIIKKGFQDHDELISLRTGEMIEYVKEEDRKELQEILALKIKKAFQDYPHDNPDTQYIKSAAEMIRHAKEEDKKELQEILALKIKKVLRDDGSPYTRKNAARMIEYTKEEDRKELQEILAFVIRKMLQDEDENRSTLVEGQYNRMKAAEMIQYTKEEDRRELIEMGLKDFDPDVRARAIEMIEYAKEDDRRAFIEIGLGDKEEFICVKAVGMIEYVKIEERGELIKRLLQDDREYVSWRAVEMIGFAKEEDKKELQEILALKIKKGQEDADEYIRNRAAHAERYFLEKLVDEPTEKKIHSSTLKELATQTVLYKEAPDTFFRHEFEKSGSETTLLESVPGDTENTLKGRVILRHIDISPYLNWKKAYEAVDFWKSKGFEYVPVEPIVAISRHKDPTKVSVFTRVLNGPTVNAWGEKGGTFQKYIHGQVSHIEEGLQELKIKHGHTHDANFVVMFPRTEKGEVDISKPPRVYVIDFDQAQSSPRK